LGFVGQPQRGGMFIAAVGVNLLKLRQERHLRSTDAAPLGLKRCSDGANKTAVQSKAIGGPTHESHLRQ
jgi:hypothetical protein